MAERKESEALDYGDEPLSSRRTSEGDEVLTKAQSSEGPTNSDDAATEQTPVLSEALLEAGEVPEKLVTMATATPAPQPTAAVADLERYLSPQRDRRVSGQQQITRPDGAEVSLLSSWVAERDGRSWTPPPRRAPTPPPPERQPAMFQGKRTLDSWIAKSDGRSWKVPKRRAPPASDFRDLPPPKKLRRDERSNAKEGTSGRASPVYTTHPAPADAAPSGAVEGGRKRKRTPSRPRAEKRLKHVSESEDRGTLAEMGQLRMGR